ncbi:hypothetical protein CXG45_07655 [Pseudomonas plecoglossicida]|uniref:Uncharacterized protein n=1 Tax=Pseudomonas plecoglossicida TaxID=70775 RepID=A0ABX4U111_PSEDL|nr:hypothetical protein [Pseudomonas plecoglossicida]PLU86288.1 hypothetical protein CXG44_15715 [Pseudomonas plecoglossicida]PLU94041.1 hypothetical protein CXG45_07655 [Pseudomonas plecoglossicida]PLV04882.1 hypothetical protein CXG48_07515 [Pseudomonas plecoglossicida]PLV14297.1 hypothetical protein CXG47_12955 [Pseudomonas plecoglossicida]
MPTENRSSTIDQHDHIEGIIDMVSVPRELTPEMREAFHASYEAYEDGHGECPDSQWVAMLRAAPKPIPQPHPEPIAWMVGTAFWWTKEEAERDAANTGLPIVDLGPMTGAAEVDRLRVELGYMREERDDLSAKLDRFYSRSHGIKNLAAIEELSDKLAERDALLRDKSGDLIRMAAHLISAPLFALQDLQDEDKKMTRARVDHAVDVADARLKDAAYELRRIADALSASAEPSAPVERDHEIPGTSFQRLNALANQGE